ncbi:MAG: hypothetical protein VX730_03365 [Pseudomonadota bacterium]|nr:hypothetical protein [Pseudomonadota bacterium]
MERRKNNQPTDSELYKEFKTGKRIKHERRSDELSRLQEIHSQKVLWWKVITACFALNTVFIILAILGTMGS